MKLFEFVPVTLDYAEKAIKSLKYHMNKDKLAKELRFAEEGETQMKKLLKLKAKFESNNP